MKVIFVSFGLFSGPEKWSWLSCLSALCQFVFIGVHSWLKKARFGEGARVGEKLSQSCAWHPRHQSRIKFQHGWSKKCASPAL